MKPPSTAYAISAWLRGNLKDSEKAELTATSIALDGIAVVVNLQTPLQTSRRENGKKHLCRRDHKLD
jgi:ABC-type phosphate transport system substrate-binding protein